MKFEFLDLGFSFELPEGWSQDKHRINPSFLGTIFLKSDYGKIMLMPGEIKDELVYKESREEFLRQDFRKQGGTNIVFSPKPTLIGNENNVVYAEFDKGFIKTYAISVVRGGFCIEIRAECDLKEGKVTEAVEQMMKTFRFTTPSKPIQFIPREETKLPSPIYEVLTARSPEEELTLPPKTGQLTS
jgi:hypothetical protein